MSDNDKDMKDKIEEAVEEILDETPQTPLERFFYHQRRALEETGKALDALLPEGFKQHGGEATREFAKGFRVLVDAAIDELKKVSEREEAPAKDESDDDDDKPSTTGKGKVKVKVD
jgi:PHP family Zn ribbon phosphoesterase